MIIYPESFMLTPAPDAVDLANPRIGYQTYLRDLEASAIAASSATETGPADAPLREDTAECWQPAVLPATWTANFGAAHSIDYVGIASHTIGSKGASVKVQTSTNGIDWTDFSDEVAPEDDAPLMFLDDAVFASWVRIVIAGGQPPKVGVIYAGEVLAMERPIYGGFSPTNLCRVTELYKGLSRGGQFLGQSFESHGVEGQAPFKNLSEAWYRENFEPFVKAARGLPFFFGWQPDAFPRDIVYGWVLGDIAPSYMGDVLRMQVTFTVHGIGHD